LKIPYHKSCLNPEIVPIVGIMQRPPEQTAPATILVVDDHAPIRELIQEMLTDHGYKVMTAADGADALSVLDQSQIDLVLLDVVMPGKNGFDVCREIKANPSTSLIPVVFVTALSDKESRILAIEAGADDLLTLPVDRIELLARVRSLFRLKLKTNELERAESVLLTLARIIEGRDARTQSHCERISDLSRRLGEQLGLPDEQVAALKLAGVVHDIGKIGISDSILLKPGPLSSEEWTLMREHPILGERICAPLRSFRLVLQIIRHHHEKCDGSGYPDGLRGDDIPLTARILQVVDIYDALISVRPYKSAMSANEAIRTLRDEVHKGWWDADVLREFERLLEDDSDRESWHKVIEYAN